MKIYMKGDKILIDELTFNKAKNGDGESFYKLIEPIKEKLYRIAYAYLNNEDDTLDCIQESIVKAIQSLDKVKEPQYFYTWMIRITINTCKDYIRKNKKIRLVNIDDYKDEQFEHSKYIEDKQDIYEMLNELTDKERELIIMRYVDDLLIKDISSKINKPIGTIKSSISRAVKKMRIYMEADKYE